MAIKGDERAMMDERELTHLAREAGRDAADGINPDTVAERVVARLRAAEQGRIAPAVRRVLTAAAAVAVLVAGTLVWRSAGLAPGVEAIALTPVPLDNATPAVLAEVLDSLDLGTPVAVFDAPSLDDLTAGQLQELLARMEG